jgi:hypothetical protein
LRDYNDLLELDGKRVEDVTTEDDALRSLAKQRGVNFAGKDIFTATRVICCWRFGSRGIKANGLRAIL